MFDLGWTELLVIATVAIIVVGPKDLPKLMRSVGRWARKARRMAAEFQEGLEDMVRDDELTSIKRDMEGMTKLESYDPTGPDKTSAQGSGSKGTKTEETTSKSEGEQEAGAAAKPAKPAASSTPGGGKSKGQKTAKAANGSKAGKTPKTTGSKGGAKKKAPAKSDAKGEGDAAATDSPTAEDAGRNNATAGR